MYDFLVVGAGLYGATFAHLARQAGYRCLVLERRSHVAGNCHSPLVEGIRLHQYGAHIFHTTSEEVWGFVQQFADFNHFRNAPVANYQGEIYNLPFNMNTFNRLWGVVTPQQAQQKLDQERSKVFTREPGNLEEQALNLVGAEIYEKLVRHYTEKQWGRPCRELPAFIIRRLPLRLNYDNSYFDDPWQGIPQKGYTRMVEKMLQGIQVRLNTDYLKQRAHWDSKARVCVFTGALDAYFEHRLGSLQYRSLTFEQQTLEMPNFQGNAVVNYTDAKTPYTRIIEHKHFAFGNQNHTIISREYSLAFTPGQEPYYPINDQHNNALCQRYQELAKSHPQLHLGGRLGSYRYLNMDQVVLQALEDARPEALQRLLERARASAP